MAGVSSFLGLQTSLRGLLAQQRGLDVTSHNVSNSNTIGYSRQEAVLAPSMALRLPAGGVQDGGASDLGTGVDVLEYKRIRDVFLDIQYRAQNTNLGDATQTAESLNEAELAFAEPGENGIADRLGKLWSAWSDLSNAPDSTAARQSLVEQANSLATALKTLDQQLASAGAQAGAEYNALVGGGGEIATIARELAGLNTAISGAIGAGSQPNDLLDRRDLLLDRLSEYGQVSVSDAGGGMIDVSFGDAANPLVSSTTTDWPQTLANPGGKLGSLLEISRSGGTIDQYRSDLDDTVETLANSINAIHTSAGGPAFFAFTSGSAASTLTVAVSAAGVQTSASPAAGANELARAISGLRGGGADQSYNTLVARVGNDVREATRGQAAAQTLRDSVDDRRQSVSGTSLDEEMSNLIRFQRAYQASARTLSTMDETLDVLINRTGRVGL
jgi:flagellar hook-associated protein 1